MLLLLAGAALALFAALLLVWAVRDRGHWARRGVASEPGMPFVGAFGGVLLQKTTMAEVLRNIYRKHPDEPAVGILEFRRPALLLCDPEVVRTVMVRDFFNFGENGFDVDAKLDPLFARNPFFLKGEKWKKTRSQLTPAFSSGRLKALHEPLAAICQEFVEFVRREAPAAQPDGLDVKELAAKFTTEVVSGLAFAVRANSFRESDAEIRRMGRRLFNTSVLSNLVFFLALLMPSFTSLIRMRIMPLDVQKFFRRLVGEAVAVREASGKSANDFLQLLIDLKQKLLKEGDSSYGNEEITAHAITFFTDGFETSSVALSFLLHDLGTNAAAQKRLREELRALGGVSQPEEVLKAPYLQACLLETLRLHPPVGFLEKRCAQDCDLPLPGRRPVKMRKGDHVVVPLLALHSDPALFPQPDVYQPERFLGQEEPLKGSFLPFGDGPRLCIGMRFAQTQVKMGAAALVCAFEIKPTGRTPPNPVPLLPGSFITAAEGGLWLHFEPLQAEG